MSAPNTCAVPGCGKPIPPRNQMCYTHWSCLPYAYRADVRDCAEAHRRGEASADDFAAAVALAVKFVVCVERHAAQRERGVA